MRDHSAETGRIKPVPNFGNFIGMPRKLGNNMERTADCCGKKCSYADHKSACHAKVRQLSWWRLATTTSCSTCSCLRSVTATQSYNSTMSSVFSIQSSSLHLLPLPTCHRWIRMSTADWMNKVRVDCSESRITCCNEVQCCTTAQSHKRGDSI